MPTQINRYKEAAEDKEESRTKKQRKAAKLRKQATNENSSPPPSSQPPVHLDPPHIKPHAFLSPTFPHHGVCAQPLLTYICISMIQMEETKKCLGWPLMQVRRLPTDERASTAHICISMIQMEEKKSVSAGH